MPPPKPDAPRAAQPVFGNYFDAWNSSSTGHQRAESRTGQSGGWRQSRTTKLSHQFKSGGTGGKRISDKVGPGSEDWDKRAKALISKDARVRAKCSVQDMLTGKGQVLTAEEKKMQERKREDEIREQQKSTRKRGVFDGLVIFINGSTYPLISDHKLKHLLAENGARVSIHLGRRSVTHVILGKPAAAGAGAGGGLAGGKMEKEIRKIGGCGVKYVGIEWVLESVKSGIRLSETKFSNLDIALAGQKSVYSMFKKTTS